MNGFLPPFERLQYVDGQVLASRDLREAERDNQRLRALHVRYLHRTWGISLGLGIAAAPNRLAGIVQPGYAIDAFGNGIFVRTDVTVETPRLSQAQVLALALSAPGTLEWWLPRDLVPGAQVLLGAAFVSSGLISGAIDASVRRYARSFAAPRLATGDTGATHWTDSPGPATWVETVVDTASAGFVGAPQYFATLQPSGARMNIVSAGPQSFIARVIGATAQEAEAEAWTVSWIGIESEGLL